MKFRSFLLMVAALGVLSLAGCNEQQMARQMGGTYNAKLACGKRVVNVTWKGEGELWILTEPLLQNVNARTLSFKADSVWGVWEGEVILRESHCPN